MNINQLKRSASTKLFNPRTILGTKLAAWWDFKTQSNLGFGSGYNVSQVNDLSGNGKHATQASGSVQPNYDPVKKCITFTLNDFLNVSLSLSGSYCVFAKCNNTKNDGNNSILLGSTISAEAAVSFVGAQGYKFGGFAGNLVWAGSDQQNIVGVYGFEVNATTSDKIYIGSNSYTVDAGNYGITSVCIGRSPLNYFVGDIYEIVITNAALASVEVVNLIRYLNGVVT